MPRVTIICLIYRSPAYAIGLYNYLKLVTPSLESGEADFLFVANNANSKTLKTLKKFQIPFVEFNQEVLTDAQHSALGFATPEYIGRVYAAYNFGIQRCRTPLVALINSDMVFSHSWLEELLVLENGKQIVSCELVERNHPKFDVFPGAITKNFGSSFKNLRWHDWLLYSGVKMENETSVRPGGAYMPSLFRTQWFKEIGFYPEGNVKTKDGSYNDVAYFGDEFLFAKFEQHGISHVTTSRSLCYHFKEGERGTSLIQKFNIIRSVCKQFIFRVLGRIKNFVS